MKISKYLYVNDFEEPRTQYELLYPNSKVSGMKKAIGLILTLATCTGLLMAQKSQYFTYDRDRIDREMAMITEATVKLGSFDLIAGDSVKAKEIPNQAFYLIGLGSGCLGTIAGFYLGSVVNVPYLGYVGGGLGILVPALIVGLRSHKEVTDPTKTPEEIAGIKAKSRQDAAKTAGSALAAVGGCFAVSGVAAIIVIILLIKSFTTG